MNRHRRSTGAALWTRLLPAIVVLLATPAKADEVAHWRSMIEEASTRFGIPARWIESVMRAESRGQTELNGHPIRSRAGAMGLMQLMPMTWSDMRARLALGANPDDPRDNILAGTFFLRLMYDRFGYPGLFGAYNAGPAAYAAWRAGTRQLPRETIAYLATVAGSSLSALPARQSPPPPALFFVRQTLAADPSTASDRNQPASLFAVRNVAP
jgi:soluble lytic murein transglycosylase-like protein